MNRRLLPLLLLAVVLLPAACSTVRPLDRASSLGELEYSTVRVNDAEIAYRVLGRGDPLLMIMGFSGTMDVWDVDLVRDLSKTNTVILMDNRGLGGSSSGTRPVTMAGMADDCAGLLHALDMDKAHVLGWSMGGLIAQELALNHPGRVGRVVLMGTDCGNGPATEITQRIMAMDIPELLSHFFTPAWLERYPDSFSRLPRPASPPSPEAVKAQAEAIAAWPGTCNRLKELDKDVLVVVGTRDDILPEKYSAKLAMVIPGAWLVRYKNSTHWLQYQVPHRLARLVSTFLSDGSDALPE